MVLLSGISDHPKRNSFFLDIARGESYVCILDGEIAGTAALSLEEEPNYLKIYNGCWISEGELRGHPPACRG